MKAYKGLLLVFLLFGCAAANASVETKKDHLNAISFVEGAWQIQTRFFEQGKWVMPFT